MPEPDVEYLITCAKSHGEASLEPDHEVGDLQDLLRLAWDLMTSEQRTRLFTNAAELDLTWDRS